MVDEHENADRDTGQPRAVFEPQQAAGGHGDYDGENVGAQPIAQQRKNRAKAGADQRANQPVARGGNG